LLGERLPIEVVAVPHDLPVAKLDDADSRPLERSASRFVLTSVWAQERPKVRSLCAPLIRDKVALADQRDALDREIGKRRRESPTALDKCGNSPCCSTDRDVCPLTVRGDEILERGPVAPRERLAELTHRLDVAIDRQLPSSIAPRPTRSEPLLHEPPVPLPSSA
jgi:hypothetical protein